MTYQKNIRLIKLNNASIYFVLFFVYFGAANCFAMELDASFYSETEYTTNARLVTTNTEDDVIQRVGINVMLREERKRFNANASFNLSQELYLNNTYTDQTQLTTGFGLFNFDIVEGFLDWRTSFTRKDVLSDATASDTPDNREQRNTFRTGPNINYRINQASTIQFGANYVQVGNSDEQAADTKRIDANASYIYQYNSITNFSLNSNYDRVIEVKESGQTRSNSNEHSQNISLNVGMNRQFSHGSFSAQVGRNEVRSEDSQTVTGNFFNIQLQREQVYYHNIITQYSESISDSSIGFESLDSLIDANPSFSQDNPRLETTSQLDIIKQKSANISINRSIDLYQYTLRAFWADQNYDIQLSDERSVGMSLNIQQKIQEGLSVGFTYEQVMQKLLDSPNDGDNFTRTFTIDTSYRWTVGFSTDGFIAYEKRGNNKDAIKEYEDFSIGVTLNWDLY
jgi:hypothetical protein